MLVCKLFCVSIKNIYDRQTQQKTLESFLNKKLVESKFNNLIDNMIQIGEGIIFDDDNLVKNSLNYVRNDVLFLNKYLSIHNQRIYAGDNYIICHYNLFYKLGIENVEKKKKNT